MPQIPFSSLFFSKWNARKVSFKIRAQYLHHGRGKSSSLRAASSVALGLHKKLDCLTVSSLSALLTRIGGKSTAARKAELVARSQTCLLTPKFPPLVSSTAVAASIETHPNASGPAEAGPRTTARRSNVGQSAAAAKSSGSIAIDEVPARTPDTQRILSIDMGVQNLAFCIADVRLQEASPSGDSTTDSAPIEIHVCAWKRVKAATYAAQEVPTGEQRTSDTSSGRDEDPWSPQNLSRMAYLLVRTEWLPYRPDIILIERQRFRSGGGSAVQEWTLRVNLFEATIWSAFETLRGEAKRAKFGCTGAQKGIVQKDYEKQSKEDGQLELSDEEYRHRGSHTANYTVPPIYAISPSRVARLWIPNVPKVTKKHRIDMLRGWLLDPASARLSLHFESVDAQASRDLFTHSNHNRKRQSKVNEPGYSAANLLSTASTSAANKLDDLTDSLLQAATWARWETSRRWLLERISNMDRDEVKTFVSTLALSSSAKNSRHP